MHPERPSKFTEVAPVAGRGGARRRATVILHRRIDTLSSGSGVHLLGFCRCLAACDYDIRIVLAPVSSFGRIPVCRPDPVLAERGIALDWPGTVKLGTVFVSLRATVWRKALRRLGVALGAGVSRLLGGTRRVFPSNLGASLAAAEAQETVRAVNAQPSNLVIAEYSSLAPLLGGCKAARRAVLLHDLFSSRSLSFRNAGLKPDHCTLSLQEECARLADAGVCIHSSLVEATLLERQLPEVRHIWLRPRIARKGRGDAGEQGETAARVVFVGADHGGNRAALDLILHDIWPRVRPHVPHELWIVGGISNWVTGRPERVRCVRFLEDLGRLGGAETVGIAPMRAASGISIKIATYLELGMRVLASRQALDAFGDALDGVVVTADTPEEFAATLIEMLLHPAGGHGRAQADIDALQPRLSNAALLEYLQEPDPPPGVNQKRR